MKVRELIEALAKMDQDAPVLRLPRKSSGVSESVHPRQSYILPIDAYGPPKDGTEPFPVVWL